MDLLPVGIRLSGKLILVVGGGAVALRKVRMLLRCHAEIVVVSPQIRPELRRMAAAKKIVWRQKSYESDVLKSAGRPFMVFACTDCEDINERAARDAAAAGIWLNRADSPSGSIVHIPSVARFGHLTLAIFSGGRGPVYVKYVRKRLEKLMGPTVARELRLLTEFRAALRERVDTEHRRKRILTRLIEDGTLEIMARLPSRQSREMLKKCLEERT